MVRPFTLINRLARALQDLHSGDNCLSASKDRESSFHHCGSPVKLVQTWLSTRKELESCFHLCGGSVMHVQGCLCW